ILRQGLGDAAPLRLGNLKACVCHVEGAEQPLIEKGRETLARDRLDDAPKYVDRHAVLPCRARLMYQWRLGKAVDELVWREHAGFRGDTGLVKLCFRVSRFDFRNA